MSIGNFTYTTTKDITLNPSDSLPAGMMGDNDIACHEVSSQFLKQGPSILVLNTNNPFWRGSTTVKEGRFIIGDRDHAGATWGSDTNRGAVTVDRNSLLGGYGTIFANDVTFQKESVWSVGLDPITKKTGFLDVKGTLTLPSTLYYQNLGYTTFPEEGCKIATYGTLVGLDELNVQPPNKDLFLDSTTLPGSLFLKSSASRGLLLGSAVIPSTPPEVAPTSSLSVQLLAPWTE